MNDMNDFNGNNFRDYDTWHYNYMEQLKNKILEEMNKGTEYIDIDNEILEELFKQEDEK